MYDDDSLAGGDFHQESHDDVTGTSNLTDILDKVITIASYAPGIGEILGNIWTFLTFTGIIGSFSGTYHGDDIIMFANTEWGRTYTQVWSSYDSAWIFGSCVERAICKSHLSGYIYKNSNYTKIEGQERSATLYSDKYANNTWKRSTAVSNYLNSVPCSFDITGDVEYTFENSVILTHDEPSYYP